LTKCARHHLGPDSSQIGQEEVDQDTARVLGRMYDAIEYRGFGQEVVERLAAFAGVPVYNGLSSEFHPTQMLADMLTMQEHSSKPLSQVAYCYIGAARFNTGNSLMMTGCKLGMSVSICAPKSLQPAADMVAMARALADQTGASLTIDDDIDACVRGVDFLCTDVWVSMGEDKSLWADRIALLKPYQVNAGPGQADGNPNVKFMHCLPAFHDRKPGSVSRSLRTTGSLPSR
jgi:ornithine carbamoyltransferase